MHKELQLGTMSLVHGRPLIFNTTTIQLGWKGHPEMEKKDEFVIATADVDLPSIFSSATLEGLGETLALHMLAHFVFRCADPQPDGSPQEWLLEQPAHQYFLSVSNTASRCKSALRIAGTILKQVETPPPSDWLITIGATLGEYVQQQVDTFTVVAYSVLDTHLILTNRVFAWNLDDRLCRFGEITERIDTVDAELVDALNDLRLAVQPLADSRHHFVHRAKNRQLPLFSAIERLRKVMDVFSFEPDNVKINDEGARKELLDTLRDDLARITAATQAVDAALLAPYKRQMLALRGFGHLSRAELTRSMEAIEYLCGVADRPNWWPLPTSE